MKKLILLAIIILSDNIASAQAFEKVFGLDSLQNIQNVSPVSDNGFIIGLTLKAEPNFPIVVKVDNNSVTQWAKKINLPSGSAIDPNCQVIESNQGGYLFFASLNGTTSSIVIKLDSNGDEEWNLTQDYDDYEYTELSSIREFPDGDIILFRSYSSWIFFSRISQDGNLLWTRTLTQDTTGLGKNPGFNFECMSDGSIIVTGKRGSDNCFARVDASGNLLWNRVLVFSGTYNQPRAITTMDDGNLLVGGYGAPDFFLKLNSLNGDVIWRRDIANGSTPDDIIALGGNKYLVSTSSPYHELFVIDENGETLDSRFLENFDISIYGYSSSKIKKRGAEIFYTFRCFENSTSNIGYVMIKTSESLYHPCSYESLLQTDTTLYTVADGGNLFLQANGTYHSDSVTTTSMSLNIAMQNICFASGLVEESLLQKMVIYPNPISESNSLTIEIKNSNSNKVMVSDLTGKIILNSKFNTDRFEISFGGLSNGMYLINVTNELGETFTQKIVKE